MTTAVHYFGPGLRAYNGVCYAPGTDIPGDPGTMEPAPLSDFIFTEDGGEPDYRDIDGEYILFLHGTMTHKQTGATYRDWGQVSTFDARG